MKCSCVFPKPHHEFVNRHVCILHSHFGGDRVHGCSFLYTLIESDVTLIISHHTPHKKTPAVINEDTHFMIKMEFCHVHRHDLNPGPPSITVAGSVPHAKLGKWPSSQRGSLYLSHAYGTKPGFWRAIPFHLYHFMHRSANLLSIIYHTNFTSILSL